MFKDIIELLREGVGAFDTSDVPAEPATKKRIGPPRHTPLKAIHNVGKPISPIGSVLHAAGGKKRMNKLPGATESSVFGDLISEARDLIEGRSKVQQYAGQKAMADRSGKVPFHLPFPTRSKGRSIPKSAGDIKQNRQKMAYGVKSVLDDPLKAKQTHKDVAGKKN